MTDLALTDRNKVNEMADRIAEFLPQSKSLPKDTRLAIAQIALAHRLDPFLGDIWAIPERNNVDGQWQTTGYRIMIGISAWRRAAQESGEYWGRHFEKATEEERKWLGAGPNDLAMRCIIYRRKTGQQPSEYDGFGVFKMSEKSKMNPLQCVRLRAERDALKGAFPIGFGGGAVKIGVADDSGEEINGDIDHGVKWDVITTEPADAPAPDAIDAKSEVTAAPAPAPVKKCSIKTPLFSSRLMPALAEKTTYYNDGKDAPQPYHVLGSAAKCGYSEITADNVEAVLNDLVQHAIEQTLEPSA
jgi:hypothetical protein